MIQKRQTQSKAKIKAAITELLLKNSDFNSITIRKITEKAQVNRSTFYLHYQDKYDLVDKLAHEVTRDFKEYLMLNSANGGLQENLIQALTYLQSQQKFMYALSQIIQINFSQRTRDFIKELITENPSFFYDSINPSLGLSKEYMLVTYAASIESLYIHWITTGAQESPQEIADMFLVIRGFYQKT
ncbi:TetR/AcrR family transcriptional regulator [Streptococcus mutans]|uniref:TetR/AcrR family transcriptional regulator n=1 Tax=Streptococcus mutans TaxID=1309 RepID=UPI0002B53ECA|nr:TetR/AcrR family transcriptional regulator C-terminal domain-containing protein [Streptococcus mutans]EMB60599.1 putative transcriptional regulator [Streptococcus mutans 15JP3]EMB86294.1 putative transcriptional regulator [Streptococcus mutans A9]EMP67998.1 transcriptional regulator [Streptococcus mutans NCTC 11060]MCB4930279.1 TetR/AcrR family transcriptional regulator C-terminal domain-containing protein [Streptococcus mutans]MCB5006109.1 TetR/AcrR family transcriptional regulator C-termi